jgi:putative salt-induced outer membrane protein YdiY
MAAGALTLFAAATIAAAADSNPADVKDPPKQKKWDSVATVGATLTRGNSKTFLASAMVGTKRTWTNDEALFGASAGYGESTATVNGDKIDTTTDSYVRGYGQWNHLFTPNIYGGLRVTGDHDDIAALTYRLTVGPLLGSYFIKQSNASLSGEVGPSYVREKYFGEEVKDYIALRIAERGERKFDSGAKIWESLEWLPKVQDLQNYLLNMEAGVSAPINKALSVSLILQDTYNSKPAAHKLENDMKLIAGLSYTF